ncbi:MAG: tryptophan--tRNA ligase [Sphaerochaetaceae bacterium]|jgi:tryptophanyl-tRNA synthetase|nr:tryptophan--tRNA ligase [Sphaerochaetaceae bacterium]MDD3366198.1 tryptophan--tRNA ligase [Sphaerochaetaceae bacterium]MDD4218885.1 tryptophan--tRNA ligase [Sphaerochaetaceae bacterium]
MNQPKKRILTGDRTTGRLHLGHYVGSLINRVALQDTYDTFILLADVQALTTHFEHPELLQTSIYDVTIDNLSVGLDPNKVTFVQQSAVKAIAEMTIFYSMIVSVNALRHNPTIKSEAAQYGYEELSYGFLGYPVSQTADITFCNADLVPVGEDQIPHLELSRKIVRKFNNMYGTNITVPKIKLSATPRLAGLDGNAKMSKSLGNAIYLSDTPEEVNEKVRKAVTDPARVTKDIPGNPEICNVAKYHKIFTPDRYEELAEKCRTAKIGCVECKKILAESLNTLLEPMREKRAYYEAHMDEVRDIIITGSRKASEIGDAQVALMREAMHLAL